MIVFFSLNSNSRMFLVLKKVRGWKVCSTRWILYCSAQVSFSLCASVYAWREKSHYIEIIFSISIESQYPRIGRTSDVNLSHLSPLEMLEKISNSQPLGFCVMLLVRRVLLASWGSPFSCWVAVMIRMFFHYTEPKSLSLSLPLVLILPSGATSNKLTPSYTWQPFKESTIYDYRNVK